MKTIKKLQKTHKYIASFITKTIKNYKQMKKQIKTLWLLTLCITCLTACGSTKVLVDKPAAGTQTTITVTTNNPITTEVNPNTELKNEK